MIDQTLLESEFRKEIGQKLLAGGWVIEAENCLNASQKSGVALCDSLTKQHVKQYLFNKDIDG